MLRCSAARSVQAFPRSDSAWACTRRGFLESALTGTSCLAGAVEADRAAGEFGVAEVDPAAGELDAVEIDLAAGEHGAGEVTTIEDHAREVEVQALPGLRRASLEMCGDNPDGSECFSS